MHIRAGKTSTRKVPGPSRPRVFVAFSAVSIYGSSTSLAWIPYVTAKIIEPTTLVTEVACVKCRDDKKLRTGEYGARNLRVYPRGGFVECALAALVLNEILRQQQGGSDC